MDPGFFLDGAHPGLFLGGGAHSFVFAEYQYKVTQSGRGGGACLLHHPPRSAPALALVQGKNWRTERKPSPSAWIIINNKINPHKIPGPEFKPGPHWVEASTLTIVSPILQSPEG